MPQIASSKAFHNKFLLSVFGDAKEQLIIRLNSDNHLMINTHRMHKTGKSNLYTQYFDMISKHQADYSNSRPIFVCMSVELKEGWKLCSNNTVHMRYETYKYCKFCGMCMCSICFAVQIFHLPHLHPTNARTIDHNN